MATSYGASLPDSEQLLNTRSEALIALLPTVSTFISVRASLEREFGKKLVEVTSKARLHAIKEAGERGGDGGNTLEAAYMKVLEAADWDAREHLALAEVMQVQVVDALASAAVRLEGVRKKHHQFAAKLLAERNRAYSDRDKSKQRYFDACEMLESARLKKSQAKDDRALEKATKVYDLAVDDMEIAKNQFLIDTDVANVAKSRLYNTDLPALHDDFQLLEASSVSQLVFLVLKGVGLERNTLGKLLDNVQKAEEALRSINIDADQATFAGTYSGEKLTTWQLPRDLEFEVCPVWHDLAEMATTPAANNYLQNIKLKSLSRLSEISPSIESKRREISGLRNLREAYEKDRSLGDAASVLENLFESMHETVTREIEQTGLRAEVELINATLPDSDGDSLRLHNFKSSSFVTPASCQVCEGTIWGKGLSCKACGTAVHAKCELKVPAGCSRTPGASVSRSRSRKDSSTSHRTTPSLSSTLSRSPTVSSQSPSIPETPFLPPPSRAPPPTSHPGAPPPTSQPATMLYDYAATTAFELSVAEADVVTVVEGEDDAGWCKVSTRDGRVGLVPASYLQLDGAAEEQEQEEGQQVVVLYDYVAQTEDEMSVVEGEYLGLTEVGKSFGEGWAEVTKEGRAGIVPSSYIRDV